MKLGSLSSPHIRTGRLLARSLVLLLSFLLLLGLQAAYLHHTRRVYFPFERRPPLRRPLSLSQFPLVAKNKTKTAVIFTLLTQVVVHRYVQFHKRERFRKTSRKLIWTGKGNTYGFGDRFRGILHAYLCAVLSERVLLIEWSDPFPLSVIFRSAAGINVMYDPAADGPGILPVVDTNQTRNIGRNESRRQQQRSFAGSRLFSTGKREFPWCECTLSNLGILLSPHRTVVLRSERPPSLRRLFNALALQRDLRASRALAPLVRQWRDVSGAEGDTALFALIFRQLLRPAPEFLALLARQSRALKSFIPTRLRPFAGGAVHADADGGQGYVSVHARVGYGLGENATFAQRFDLQRQGASMQVVARCLARRAAAFADEADLREPQRFYLACDTPAFADLFKRELKARSRGAVVAETGRDKVHSTRMRRGSSRDRERFLLTAADLFFLSAGKAMVSLPSGFANLARWFGEMPHRTVSIAQCVEEAKVLKMEVPEFADK